MSEPFAYVLIIFDQDEGNIVPVHQSPSEARSALREFAASMFAGLADSDIIDVLAENGQDVSIHAIAMERGKQTSTWITTFEYATEAA